MGGVGWGVGVMVLGYGGAGKYSPIGGNPPIDPCSSGSRGIGAWGGRADHPPTIFFNKNLP